MVFKKKLHELGKAANKWCRGFLGRDNGLWKETEAEPISLDFQTLSGVLVHACSDLLSTFHVAVPH